MVTNWRILGLGAILAWTLAVVPVRAQTDGPSTLAADAGTNSDRGSTASKQDESLRKEIEKLRQEVDDLKKQVDLLVQQQKKTQDDVANLRPTSVNGTAKDDDVKSLRDQIEALKKDLSGNRRSNYLAPSTRPDRGRIRLVNTYTQPQTVVVNGRAYELAPNETRVIDVPAGEVTYEVLGVTGVRPRQLAPNEMLTINIHPTAPPLIPGT